MFSPPGSVLPIAPTAQERDALAIVECYLSRVGNATGTLMLSVDGAEEAALAIVIRDQCTGSAALCRSLLDVYRDSHEWLMRLP